MGATVVHVPLIEVGDPADGGVQLRAALARLAAFDWLVVTSANGARRAGPAAAGHPALRLAAVGPATAAALAAAAGRDVDLVPAEARAEGLLAEFPPPPARVLLAQADRARRMLADGLAAGGHTVESVIAYRTVARRPSPDEVTLLTSADAVLLASGSAAAAWAEAIGAVAAPPLVAIGPVTAADAAGAGPHDRPRRDVTGRVRRCPTCWLGSYHDGDARCSLPRRPAPPPAPHAGPA